MFDTAGDMCYNFSAETGTTDRISNMRPSPYNITAYPTLVGKGPVITGCMSCRSTVSATVEWWRGLYALIVKGRTP